MERYNPKRVEVKGVGDREEQARTEMAEYAIGVLSQRGARTTARESQ